MTRPSLNDSSPFVQPQVFQFAQSISFCNFAISSAPIAFQIQQNFNTVNENVTTKFTTWFYKKERWIMFSFGTHAHWKQWIGNSEYLVVDIFQKWNSKNKCLNMCSPMLHWCTIHLLLFYGFKKLLWLKEATSYSSRRTFAIFNNFEFQFDGNDGVSIWWKWLDHSLLDLC